MPVPWLQVIDADLGVANFARGRKPPPAPEGSQAVEVGGHAAGGLEARLAGVVVAALREAFERDSRRLDLEREQMEAERQRAERALRLELQRQAGEREIGRLRLLTGVAGTAWMATLLLSARLAGSGIGARASLGAGWLFLLGAIAASFIAQSGAAAALHALATDVGGDASASRSGASGAVALWLMIGGLILVGLSALLA
jgi:hypothetical protein